MTKSMLALATVVLVSIGTTKAQFLSRGTIIGSGSISFYTGKDKSGSLEETVTTMGFSPWAGFLVIDNLSIGGAINYSSSKYEIDGSSSSSSSGLTIGPVARFYPTDGGFFLQAYVGIGKTKSESGSFESDSPITEFIASGGYSVRITDTVLLDPMLGYWSQKFKDYDSTSNRICFTVSFTILFAQ